MKTIDVFLAEYKKKINCKALKAKFIKPVFDNDICKVKIVEDTDCLEFTVFVNSQKVLYAVVILDDADLENDVQDYLNSDPVLVTPIEQNQKSILNHSDSFELRTNEGRLKKMFPNLYLFSSSNLNAVLLGSTRTVGVFCPGANSLYSEIQLKKSDESLKSFNFIVSKLYNSVNLINISFAASSYKGNIKAFFRKPPQLQKDIKDVLPLVSKSIFENEKVLIIGGSRGLGENVAKIMAAGGANVTITYSQGEIDAQRVVDQISSEGLLCTKIKLDVLNIPADESMFKNYNSIFYFATPFIEANTSEELDSSLFEKYNSYYVESFLKIALICIKNKVNRVFYPSTIYIDERPEKFREYTAAKLKGEQICADLHAKSPYTKIYFPRLPKMATDQTAGLYNVESMGAFPVIYQEVLNLYKK